MEKLWRKANCENVIQDVVYSALALSRALVRHNRDERENEKVTNLKMSSSYILPGFVTPEDFFETLEQTGRKL